MTNKLTTVSLIYCVAWSVTSLATAATRIVPDCEVRVRIDSGWLCGAHRFGDDGVEYASFRGVPYAKQPVGERRFKELDPVVKWVGSLNVTTEGPVCPQHDVFYKGLMKPQGQSEACIHANIHVPWADLPEAGLEDITDLKKPKLPILVYIHGGGFAFGSGDSDVHGPEYLVPKRVIVITFNYRIGPFGFLSLNSSSIPGNNGLRDQMTLLRWVQRNARAFGGDSDDVTLGGQSAGSVSAHLLSLSSAARGLFKRVILMSGTASLSFFSFSPKYAQNMASLFLAGLGINSTDNEEIHRQLIDMPLEKITTVHQAMLDRNGLVVFVPVVESFHAGVERIVEDYPEVLVAQGRGNDIPCLIGFNNKECESFKSRFVEIDLLSLIAANPLIMLPARLVYSLPIEVSTEAAFKMQSRYFNGKPTMDKLVQCLTDSFFIYPAIKLAEIRAAQGAPVYLYGFSYDAERSTIKEGLGLNVTGAPHVEDMTYIFKTNSILGGENDEQPMFHSFFDVYKKREGDDEIMKEWMTTFVINFMECSDPTCSDGPSWPPTESQPLEYQEITNLCWRHTELTDEQMEMKQFYDVINQYTRL